jgi:hypothetical protein
VYQAGTVAEIARQYIIIERDWVKMETNIHKEKIDGIFKHLLRVHKSLIDFQKLVIESLDQKRYTPYEMWNMSINHAEFAWLRKISGVMALMDEATSDKKNPATEQQLKDFVKVVSELFSESNPDADFKKRFNIAVARDPKLAKEVIDLKAALAAIG